MLPFGPGGAPSLWCCPYWHSPTSAPSARHALTTAPSRPLTWHLGESARPVGEAGGPRRGCWGYWGRPCS
jgi:hypothetical protein